MFHYEYFAHRDGCHTQHSQHQLTKFTKNRFVSRTPHFLKFEKDLVPLSIAAHTVHAMMLIHVCRLTTDIMSQRNSICALALAYVSTHHLILGIPEQDVITSIMNAYTTLPVESTFVTLYSGNYANPVYSVATICHQVRCLRWGHPSLFHTATSLLIWYKCSAWEIYHTDLHGWNL